jgi:hypothetical protein
VRTGLEASLVVHSPRVVDLGLDIFLGEFFFYDIPPFVPGNPHNKLIPRMTAFSILADKRKQDRSFGIGLGVLLFPLTKALLGWKDRLPLFLKLLD